MFEIKEFDSVYPPSEDSMLLLKAVKYARGDVLDICAGTGIIGINAAPLSRKVTFIDINPHAIKAIKYNAVKNGITNFECIKSDLFSGLGKRRFDIVYANPPYLPGDKNRDWMDLALNGGAEGYETTIRILRGLNRHLKPRGTAFLVLSSAYDINKVYKEIKRLKFSFRKLSSVNFFFEELFLIKIYGKSRNSGK
jgi:HemK-related putative methylase